MRNTNNVLLDLVIVSPHLQDCKVEIDDDPLLALDKHHPALSLNFECSYEWVECEQIRTIKFNFKKANFNLMYRLIQNQDWKTVYDCCDINVVISEFYRIFHTIFNQCVPLSTQVGKTYPVWYNGEIIKLIKSKERYLNKYKKSKAPYWYNKYKYTRKQVKGKIKKAHDDYMTRVGLSLYNDPKYFWSYIKSQKTETNIPEEMHYNNVSCTGSKNTANMFALYFSSVFSPGEFLECNAGTPKKYYCDSPFTENEVLLALKKLKGNRAIGPDGLPGYIVKGCSELLLKPLLYIFNLSLKTSTYPTDWRISKVIPTFKSGVKQDITNYRPITIVNAVSKVFEIVLFNRIYDEVKHSISQYQHGFVPKKSTLTNLITFSQFIDSSFNNKAQVDVIYTDMEKAFDKVRHSIIIKSLKKMNVTENLIDLISSYLIDRKQYIEIKGAKSNMYCSTSGVPQGSNLGPLLFLVTINDISQVVKYSKTLLFSDDFKL